MADNAWTDEVHDQGERRGVSPTCSDSPRRAYASTLAKSCFCRPDDIAVLRRGLSHQLAELFQHPGVSGPPVISGGP